MEGQVYLDQGVIRTCKIYEVFCLWVYSKQHSYIGPVLDVRTTSPLCEQILTQEPSKDS